MRLQVSELLAGQLEDEVVRKAVLIPTYQLVEPADLYAVQGGKIIVQQHPLTPQNQDCLRNLINRHEPAIELDAISEPVP